MKYFLLITTLLIVTVALGIGAFRAYNQLQNLPIKSMTNIQDTIDHRDTENFYKLVDIDAVLNSAAE